MENTTLGHDLEREKKVIFLKLDHFLSTYFKKCIFNLKIPKNFFPPQMPDFAETYAMMATTRTILALTWFCNLRMCL